MSTILIAEDDSAVRSMLEVVLERQGYRVVPVGSGHECLERLGATDIDLVILDVEMPALDGWDTLAAIRESSVVPVILVTALAGDDHLQRSVDRGADAFISKPFINGDLVSTVARLLDR
jgi:CheY-like chemotaxis protein